MVRKQKTKSYLPSFKERHSPGYNWNGPGTSIPQRISLTYKGSVGSESYFLPVNKLDLSAFQHDLLYYSPDSLTRTFADWEYLKYINGNFKPSTPVYLMSNFIISSQMTLRVLYHGSTIGALGVMTFKKFKKSFEYLKKVLTTPPIRGSGSLGGLLFNPVQGIAPQSVKDVMRNYFNIRGTRGGDLSKFRKDFYYNFVPLLIMYGLSPITKPITNAKKFLDIILAEYSKTEEWLDFKAENDKVFNKYQDYLKSVGVFDKDDNFVINHTINNELAQEKYKEFFKEYQSYLGHVNKKYIQTPGFESYKIPKLNTENLDIVSLPITSEPPLYKLSDAEKQNIKNMIDPDKVFEKYKNVNEYNEDIVNILKGIRDTPDTSDISGFREPDYKQTLEEKEAESYIHFKKQREASLNVLKGIRDTPDTSDISGFREPDYKQTLEEKEAESYIYFKKQREASLNVLKGIRDTPDTSDISGFREPDYKQTLEEKEAESYIYFKKQKHSNPTE